MKTIVLDWEEFIDRTDSNFFLVRRDREKFIRAAIRKTISKNLDGIVYHSLIYTGINILSPTDFYFNDCKLFKTIEQAKGWADSQLEELDYHLLNEKLKIML